MPPAGKRKQAVDPHGTQHARKGQQKGDLYTEADYPTTEKGPQRAPEHAW